MESCHNLVSLSASCNAVKKVGGVTETVWIGKKKEFLNDGVNQNYLVFDNSHTTDPVWYLFCTDITSFSSTELASFEGMRFKNTAGFETVPGENVNAFTQNLNMVLFHYTQTDIFRLEQLLLNEDLIAFVLTEANQIKVFGIDKFNNDNVRTWDGLKTISGTGADIVELQGEVGVQIQLQATLLNMPVILSGYYNGIELYFSDNVEEMVSVLNAMSGTL